MIRGQLAGEAWGRGPGLGPSSGGGMLEGPGRWGPFSNPSPCFSHPRAAPGKEAVPFPWLGHIIMGISSAFGFIISVYLLANCRYIGPW